MTTADTLTVTTPTDREIVMTRVFDAPRPLVFDAYTRPELLRRWFGPRGYRLVVCEIDLRVGGAWHYVVRAPDGSEMTLRGVYREIVAPELVVSTETNEDCDAEDGSENLSTLTLVEHGGRTTLTNTMLYPSREIRDAMLETGMKRGVGEGYDRLAETLQEMGENTMTEIADRYRTRADAFERKVAAVRPDQWSDPSPCEEWTARDVVGHIIDMHGVMLRPLGRTLGPAPSLEEDPLGAFRAARADIEALLQDPETSRFRHDTPMGPATVEEHIDQVPSADLVLHGWDLAKATGQDATIDPQEVERAWPGIQQIPDEMRIPGAFGPGVVVFGPEVEVPEDAPLQDRMLGLVGRDPAWSPATA